MLFRWQLAHRLYRHFEQCRHLEIPSHSQVYATPSTQRQPPVAPRRARVAEMAHRPMLGEMAGPFRHCLRVQLDAEPRTFRHADDVVLLPERPVLDDVADLPA